MNRRAGRSEVRIRKKRQQALLVRLAHRGKGRHAASPFGDDVADLVGAEPGHGIVNFGAAISLQVGTMTDLAGLVINSTAGSRGHGLRAEPAPASSGGSWTSGDRSPGICG